MDIVDFSRFRLRLLAALLVIFASYACFGQISATVRGRAVDTTGRPIPNAVVRLVSDPAAHMSSHALRYTLMSDSLGKYSQGGMAPGAYLVMLFTDGKGTSVMQRLLLKAGDEATVNFDLPSEAPMQMARSQASVSSTVARRRRSTPTIQAR